MNAYRFPQLDETIYMDINAFTSILCPSTYNQVAFMYMSELYYFYMIISKSWYTIHAAFFC